MNKTFNKVFWILSLYFLIGSFNHQIHGESISEDEFNDLLEHFHVCTVATKEHPHLDKLRASCIKHRIKLDVVGMGLPFYWNATKYLYMKDYIKEIPDEDIIMFVDGFDVIIIKNKEEILLKFLNMNTPFLMSAEINCCPYPELADLFPPSPTPHRFVNTGSFIGYAANIKKLLADLEPYDPYDCDQGITMKFYVNAPEDQKPFILDYNCELFLPLFLVPPEDVIINIKDKSVLYTTTNTHPAVLHANGGYFGGAFKVWFKAYYQLIRSTPFKIK